MSSKFYSRTAKAIIAFMLIWSSLVSVVSAEEKGSAKNVILLIPDGMGISYLTATRIYKGEELSFERYVKGLMKTASADTNVTDSAAAGTAMATGYKTDNGVISVTPDGVKPDSILDAARESGKSTGLVATSRITHATPAVFTAHDPSRGNEVALATEYINNVDVILGGGRDMFLPESEGGKQPERNLVEEAKSAGYEYITNRSEIGQVDGDQILGLFALSDLKYEIDRDKQNVPSLAEMTKLAVDTLSKNDKGFFLMVEGSQIDWAGHAHDPIAMISDMLAFEEAVDVALEYARNNSDTLVVIVGDHETGGMNIGNTPGGYKENIAVLKNATGSSNTIGAELKSRAITTDVGSSARSVNNNVYLPLREIAAQLDGTLEYHADDLTVDVDVAGSTFKVHLPQRIVTASSQKQNADFFVENGTAYFNLKSMAELIGMQVAYGSGEDSKVTTAYWVDVKKVAEPIAGIKLTEEDAADLANVNWNNDTTLINEIGTVISGHALISWGSRNHTGEELPLYAYGKGANEFVGLIDNTDLPRMISYLMGVGLFENEEAFMQNLEKRRNQ